MSETNKVIVAGLGEVGRPILKLASNHYRVIGVDISPRVEKTENADVLHICYPFAIQDFLGEAMRYIEQFNPALTIINSTVAVGTTRTIAERTGAAVVNSPVRGKHAHMVEDLLSYTKFVGPLDQVSGERAARHFQSMGMKTKTLSSPEATELAKLTETTYFGLIIAWAQEIERYCDGLGQNYEEIASFHAEIEYLPRVKYFPGIIGGHCVMPNIEILSRLGPSELLQAIKASNRKKIGRDAHRGKTVATSENDATARPQPPIETEKALRTAT